MKEKKYNGDYSEYLIKKVVLICNCFYLIYKIWKEALLNDTCCYFIIFFKIKSDQSYIKVTLYFAFLKYQVVKKVACWFANQTNQHFLGVNNKGLIIGGGEVTISPEKKGNLLSQKQKCTQNFFCNWLLYIQFLHGQVGPPLSNLYQ